MTLHKSINFCHFSLLYRPTNEASYICAVPTYLNKYKIVFVSVVNDKSSNLIWTVCKANVIEDLWGRRWNVPTCCYCCDGVRLYLCETATADWLTVHPRVTHEWTRGRGGMIFTQQNRETRRSTCPSAALSTINSARIDVGANLDLQSKKPANNSLSYGTRNVSISTRMCKESKELRIK